MPTLHPRPQTLNHTCTVKSGLRSYQAFRSRVCQGEVGFRVFSVFLVCLVFLSVFTVVFFVYFFVLIGLETQLPEPHRLCEP